MRLLAGKVGGVELHPVHLAGDGAPDAQKNELKPWQREEWCIPAVSAEFVAAMEDVLDLYEEPYDRQRPTVCFDETCTQLIGESRIPLPARPGRRERFDYEYRRNGTRNLFMLCEPLRGWRHVAVTERRRMGDFAHQMRWLADEAYTKAETHSCGAGQPEYPPACVVVLDRIAQRGLEHEKRFLEEIKRRWSSYHRNRAGRCTTVFRPDRPRTGRHGRINAHRYPFDLSGCTL